MDEEVGNLHMQIINELKQRHRNKTAAQVSEGGETTGAIPTGPDSATVAVFPATPVYASSLNAQTHRNCIVRTSAYIYIYIYVLYWPEEGTNPETVCSQFEYYALTWAEMFMEIEHSC